MNTAQWVTFGIGLGTLGIFLFFMADSCYTLFDSNLLTACYIRRYAHGIPGLILIQLSIIYFICAVFEKK